MPAANVVRSSGLVGPAGRPNANSVRVDSDTDTLKFGTGASGTTEKEVADLSSTQTIGSGKTITSPTITGPVVQSEVVDATAATLAVAAATHAGRIVTLN